MAQEHDDGAERTGGFILSQIRQGSPSFRQVFSASMRRIGDWDWPRPDFVCLDDEKQVTYALEYKPPMQTKREYVCGLGQTITYLQHHNYSGLIVPELAEDGFHIARFLRETLLSDVLERSPISLFSYDPESFEVKVLKPIQQERTGPSKRTSNKEHEKAFWCWWRDMSHYEVLNLLRLSFKYNDCKGDIYTRLIFPEFWDMLTSGQTKDFEGKARHVNASSMSSYKQNYRIPFEQLRLWGSKEGRLSQSGFKLLEIGTIYGAESTQFKNALAYLILTTGHHLDLINIVSDIQKQLNARTSMEFKQLLDEALTSRGLIGKRKPSAVTTNKKGSYIRDELKIWNKFGMVKCDHRKYYNPRIHGIEFDWQNITSILTNSKLNLKDE